MNRTIMGAVVSLDGFIADDNDNVGPLFDWYGNGDVPWRFPGTDDEARSSQASADFMTTQYRDVAAVVIGRRLFDLTDGWNGRPAAGQHVFVVTHEAPTDWRHPTPRRSPSSPLWPTPSRRPRPSPAAGTSTCPEARSAARPRASG